MELILDSPAASPPPGVIPNFKNPPSKATLGYGVAIATFVISVVVTVMRLCVKGLIVKKLHLEDCKTCRSLLPARLPELTSKFRHAYSGHSKLPSTFFHFSKLSKLSSYVRLDTLSQRCSL